MFPSHSQPSRRRWRSMIRPTPKWLRRSWKKAMPWPMGRWKSMGQNRMIALLKDRITRCSNVDRSRSKKQISNMGHESV